MDDPFPKGMLAEIEEFLATDAQRPSGRLVYEDVFRTSLFFPLQRKRELAEMMLTAQRRSPKVVMEIGSDKGGGFYHWVKSQPTVKAAIACEIRGTPYDEAFEAAFPDKQFLWLSDSSQTPHVERAVKRFLKHVDAPIDCLFIDGDKSGFLQDFDLYLPCMAEHGVIFMHDIRDGGPKEAWEAVKKRGFITRVFIDTSESDEAAERMARGEPIDCPYEGWLRYWKGVSCGVGVIYL